MDLLVASGSARILTLLVEVRHQVLGCSYFVCDLLIVFSEYIRMVAILIFVLDQFKKNFNIVSESHISMAGYLVCDFLVKSTLWKWHDCSHFDLDLRIFFLKTFSLRVTFLGQDRYFILCMWLLTNAFRKCHGGSHFDHDFASILKKKLYPWLWITFL
jgi:hypothetical protein